ncbi:uncharacterized protein LOC124457844 [Xenia sp. Carnegie-2017]|uniref:uncharacterized protein LOC124457844 n=1 Tax=Xenia sp. Carnegie-2017 TaxID=2897299 RepID=UPI001F04A928|nr:uncharacterized protein LOC124457844 [Xenia sp. Carnegie-2017]
MGHRSRTKCLSDKHVCLGRIKLQCVEFSVARFLILSSKSTLSHYWHQVAVASLVWTGLVMWNPSKIVFQEAHYPHLVAREELKPLQDWIYQFYYVKVHLLSVEEIAFYASLQPFSVK